MALQVNLDDQAFGVPPPPPLSSRPRCIDAQSHIRPLPQPEFSPLPLNESRGSTGMSKEPPDLSPRLVSSRDDVIYISDDADAASDINDASHEPFDESLPSVQAIVQSLDDAEEMGNTDDVFKLPSQRTDAHREFGRLANSTPPDQELLNKNQRPTVDIAAKCPVGVSASAPRVCTSAPTSMADGSRIGSSSCESSLRDTDSPYARGCPVLADHEGTKKLSLSKIPQRVTSQLYPPSSASQSQRPASPPDVDCNTVGITPRGSPGPSQAASTKEDSFDIFDTVLSSTDTSCDQSSKETLPSVRTAVPSLEETGEIRSTIGDDEQMSKSERERELYHGPHSSTLLDRGQISHSAGFSCAELAGCLKEAPSIPRIQCPTASTRASSRLTSLSPASQVWDTVSTQTSCTSMSATGNEENEIDDQICDVTEPPETAADDSSEREYMCDEEPLMSQISLRAQNKRLREILVNHGIEQPEAEGLHGAFDDSEYCPSRGEESKDDSNNLSGDEDQTFRKRRKFRAGPSKNDSRGQLSAHPALAGLVQASEPISAAQEDAVAEPAAAAFDEWILQDVVLKRTIMDGTATFVFQFDWDLCAKHGQAPREPCKRPKQQSKAKPVVKNGRRRFTTSEDRWLVTWKEEQGLSWAEIRSRFCAKFEERSKEALQVRYCTRLKQRDDV